MEDDSQLQDCGITNAVAKAQLPSEVGLAFRYILLGGCAHNFATKKIPTSLFILVFKRRS